MNRYMTTTLLAGALALGTVVWAASVKPADETAANAECVTAAQVLAAADRSRQGISLACNEQVRQRNLERNR